MSDEEQGGDSYAESVEAYSHYREVSNEVHGMLNKCVKAYAHLNSKNSQNIGVTPQTAHSTKQAILGAALRLETELRISREADDQLDQIAARWFDDDDAWMPRLETADLRTDSPQFLGEMVRDIMTVGHSLGYLQSGRKNKVAKTAEAEDEQMVSEMFE